MYVTLTWKSLALTAYWYVEIYLCFFFGTLPTEICGGHVSNVLSNPFCTENSGLNLIKTIYISQIHTLMGIYNIWRCLRFSIKKEQICFEVLLKMEKSLPFNFAEIMSKHSEI